VDFQLFVGFNLRIYFLGIRYENVFLWIKTDFLLALRSLGEGGFLYFPFLILLPVVFVGAILVARNLIIYFWASFLADLIAIILQLAGALLIFRVLIFYFGMFLAIVVFGGAVYLLQRRIYAPQRVKLRRLKAKRCPYCETPVEFTKRFCAGCGSSLIEKCPSCGQGKFIDFKFCPNCGKS